MSRSIKILALAGAITALITLYFYKKGGNQDRSTHQKSKIESKQKRFSFRCVQSNGNDSSPAVVSVTRRRQLDSEGSIPSAVSSYESVDSDPRYENSNNSAFSNSSEDSATSEDTLTGDGSTYTRHHHIQVTDDPFYGLLNSPIIEPHPQDDRMVRTPVASQTDGIVREYAELSPNAVDDRFSSIFGVYHEIVPPLQPNTGAVIPNTG